VARIQGVVPRLPVADLRRAVDFYRDVLGFEPGLLWPDDSPSFVILERDGVSVQFYVPEASAGAPLGQGMLGFDVDDARAMHDSLAKRVNIEWGPEVYWYGRREFAILDPDGYMLIFSEETDQPPTCRDT
jgi:catechol 2,3-dioxygenase-like lactoylglutathione lyase family enzyme